MYVFYIYAYVHISIYIYIKIYFFICRSERAGERALPSTGYFSDGHNGLSRARLNLGAKNFQISHVSGRHQALRTSSAGFLRHISRKMIKMEWPGYKLVLLRDAATVGSSCTCCAIMGCPSIHCSFAVYLNHLHHHLQLLILPPTISPTSQSNL